MKQTDKKDWRIAAKKMNDGIRHELRKHPKANIDRFVRTVGATLGAFDSFQKFPETRRKTQLIKLRRCAAVFLQDGCKPIMAEPFPQRLTPKKTEDDLAAVRVLLGPFASPDSPGREDYVSRGGAFYQARDTAASAVLAYLAEIDKAIAQAQPRAPKRPPADAHGILARLAHRYMELLEERPTTTPGGTFSNIAALVLENVYGKTPADVTRQVRAALKTL